MEKYTVQQALAAYAASDPARFHMPGHKGRGTGEPSDPLGEVLPYDVTELGATDNLFDPKPGGPFERSLEFARNLYGSSVTYYSTCGATLAIQTAFRLLLDRRPSARVLAGRRCHRSAVNAMALLGIQPQWWDETSPLTAARLSGFDALYVTSPDYYGAMLDLPSLSALCRGCGVKLMVDGAHGAHLAFFDGGRLHAFRCGADMAVDSLHKTLPVLTGAALLNLRGGHTVREADEAASLFASTSPSFLTAMSIDTCLREMARSGEKRHGILLGQVEAAKAGLRGLGYAFCDAGLRDPFRVCFRDRRAAQLYEHLARHGVVCEFCDRTHVILIPSVSNTELDFRRLVSAASDFEPHPAAEEPYAVYFPHVAATLREAALGAREDVPLAQASGRICARPYCPYPPGIPAVMPGETIDGEVMSRLGELGIKTVCVLK